MDKHRTEYPQQPGGATKVSYGGGQRWSPYVYLRVGYLDPNSDTQESTQWFSYVLTTYLLTV
jgi:hypothetical protein